MRVKAVLPYALNKTWSLHKSDIKNLIALNNRFADK